jgi:hypothetical protein
MGREHCTEISRASCGKCRREVALIRRVVDSGESEVVFSRHLGRGEDGFCTGSLGAPPERVAR